MLRMYIEGEMKDTSEQEEAGTRDGQGEKNMNHLEVWEQENLSLRASDKWLLWCASAERLLGHDLDGDGDSDGYSIDEAYEFYCRKLSPKDYVISVLQRVRCDQGFRDVKRVCPVR